MKRGVIILIVIVLLVIIFNTVKAENINALGKFGELTQNGNRLRIDSEGDGNFGSNRIHGKHEGIDILADKGENIFAPIDAKFIRIAYADNDTRYKGALLQGIGKYKDIELKIFYLNPFTALIGNDIVRGEIIGKAQSVKEKYNLPNMKDHIHVEMRIKGQLVNPTQFFI